MFQKQSPSGVSLKTYFSHCKKYSRIWVSIICIFRYKGRIYDSVLTRENTGQRKLIVWHNLGCVLFEEHIWETASGVSLGDCFCKNGEIVQKECRTFPNVPEALPHWCSSKKCVCPFWRTLLRACFWCFSRTDILCTEVFCFYYQVKKIAFCFIKI